MPVGRAAQPCVLCVGMGRAVNRTHLQDDLNCEDRGETNVKVPENLQTEAAELCEIRVTCVLWHCGLALPLIWEALSSAEPADSVPGGLFNFLQPC